MKILTDASTCIWLKMTTALLILTRRSFAVVLYARTASVVTTNRTTLSLVCLKASPVDEIEEHYIGKVKSVSGQVLVVTTQGAYPGFSIIKQECIIIIIKNWIIV